MNCIIKDKNGFRLETPENVKELSYEEKQKLVKDIKMFTGYEFAYVRSNGCIIECDGFENLRKNLSIGSMFGMNTILVIQ